VPALFPAWSDTVLRIGLGVLAVGIPGVFVVPIVYVRTPYNLNRGFEVMQPVQFDHRHHVKDDGIPCLYCHDGADRSAYAGVPATEVCMGCHSQIWNQSPMLEPVRRSYFSGQPIPWNRVHLVPDFVFFNHAVHVKGGIQCAQCHGDVAAMPLDYKQRLFTMGWCLDCHKTQPDRYAHDPIVATVFPEKLPANAKVVMSHESNLPRLQTCSACHR
jgi:hypothetical protein